MPTDEVTLILAAIDGLKGDIRDSESRLHERVRDVAVVMDEHSERITAIETRANVQASKRGGGGGVNLKRVATYGGGGGFLVFLPKLVHEAAEFVRALPIK